MNHYLALTCYDTLAKQWKEKIFGTLTFKTNRKCYTVFCYDKNIIISTASLFSMASPWV